MYERRRPEFAPGASRSIRDRLARGKAISGGYVAAVDGADLLVGQGRAVVEPVVDRDDLPVEGRERQGSGRVLVSTDRGSQADAPTVLRERVVRDHVQVPGAVDHVPEQVRVECRGEREDDR